jgi:DNA polymerase III subunit delta'
VTAPATRPHAGRLGRDEPGPDDTPVASLFAGVVGQPDAVRTLRVAARRPVHAYLVVGPPGLGQRALLRGFAAALLCPDGGCGRCDVCRRALSAVHPDLVEVERAGAFVTVGDAQRVVRLAQRRPLEAHRQVIAVFDVHLARLAAPVLLKTLEEPAGPTVFVLFADAVPAELATVASRCVRVDLRPVPRAELRAWLEGRGVADDLAVELVEAAGGSVERAALLGDDPGLLARRDLWRSVPTRLDGTGAAAASLAGELLASAEDAVEPLRARHRAEMEALAEAAEQRGERGVTGRKDIEDRHNREERRFRTDELRAGFAVLAAAYRDRLAAAAASVDAGRSGRANERVAELAGAITVVERSSAELVRNPNETLLLEAMLVRLSAVHA